MDVPDDPFPDGFEFIEGLIFENEVDQEDESEEEPDVAPEGDDEQVRVASSIEMV